jgi:hypothetical protein
MHASALRLAKDKWKPIIIFALCSLILLVFGFKYYVANIYTPEGLTRVAESFTVGSLVVNFQKEYWHKQERRSHLLFSNDPKTGVYLSVLENKLSDEIDVRSYFAGKELNVHSVVLQTVNGHPVYYVEFSNSVSENSVAYVFVKKNTIVVAIDAEASRLDLADILSSVVPQ